VAEDVAGHATGSIEIAGGVSCEFKFDAMIRQLDQLDAIAPRLDSSARPFLGKEQTGADVVRQPVRISRPRRRRLVLADADSQRRPRVCLTRDNYVAAKTAVK
jgi:hypothetical protein